MARVRLVRKEEIHDEAVLERWAETFGDKDPAVDDSMIGPNGTRGDYWAALANSPTTVRHVWDGFAYLRSQKLPALYREIGMTRAGFNVGSQFVFSQHCKGLRRNGWSEEKIAGLPAWQTATVYTDVEQLLLGLADDLTLAGGRIPEARMDQLRAHLDDQEVIEFIHATLIYQMHATVCRALRVEFDDVEERVREVGGGEYTLAQT
jgi:alkylhydroperoxidase family enzyme